MGFHCTKTPIIFKCNMIRETSFQMNLNYLSTLKSVLIEYNFGEKVLQCESVEGKCTI